MTKAEMTAWVGQAEKPAMTTTQLLSWVTAIEQQAMEIVAFGHALAMQAQQIRSRLPVDGAKL